MSGREGWEQERHTIVEMREKDKVPAEKFSGHKGIFMANLEGYLGTRFPALLAERDRLQAENEDIRACNVRLVQAEKDAVSRATSSADEAESLRAENERLGGERDANADEIRRLVIEYADRAPIVAENERLRRREKRMAADVSERLDSLVRDRSEPDKVLADVSATRSVLIRYLAGPTGEERNDG